MTGDDRVSTEADEGPTDAGPTDGDAAEAPAVDPADEPGDPTSDAAASPSPATAPVFPGDRDPTTDEAGRVETTALYGRLRGYFRRNRGRFGGFQHSLRRAHMPTTYDAYLARAVVVAAAAGLAGFLLAALVTLATLVALPASGESTGATAAALTSAGLLRVLAAGIGGFAIVGGAALGLAVAYPDQRARRHASRVDRLLPHGVTYLYALSYGGVGIVDAIRSLADAEDAYGELAMEFDAITREMDYFGRDPVSALRARREETGSESLAQFLEDLDGVLETGGDVTSFLEEESDAALDRARSEQEAFLDDLATLQELYVGGLVVGPLFLILVLVIISLVGGETIGVLTLLVYLGMPVALGLFLLYVRWITGGAEPTTGRGTQPDTPRGGRETQPDSSHEGRGTPPEADERFAAYRHERRRDRLRRLLSKPVDRAREHPPTVLRFSVPAALLTFVLLVLAGVVTPTAEAMLATPLATTSLGVVLPAMVAVVPLGAFHELRARRRSTIRRRFPEFLSQLSNANKTGLDVASALDLVARRGTGPLATELRLTANDVRWAVDLRSALEALRVRLAQPALGRTLRLIGDAVGASGDVHRVLDIASKDTSAAERLARDRREEMATYTTITVISFVIYLGIVVLIDRTFIAEFAALTERLPEETPVGPIQFSRVPTETYRMLLFHSALVQAVANGLIAGQFAEDSILAGLKYALLMVLVTVGTFLVASPIDAVDVVGVVGVVP